ncbi:MAG: site-specific integrase [Pseudomonadota bacterium]
MATFRRRGKRWQAIIRKSGHPAAVKTFPNKAQAERWARITESDMDRQDWEDPTLLKDRTLDDVIAAIGEQKTVTRAMQTAYNNLSADLGAVTLSRLNAAEIAAFGRLRSKRDEAKPATVMLDLSYLQGLIKFTRTHMRLPASTDAVTNARAILASESIAGKSKERNRRPTDDELHKLEAYWKSPKYLRQATVPMWTLTEFAMATAMRLGEIVRIQWKDLDRKHKTVIIRDRLHPSDKAGNNMEVPLLPVAYFLLPDESDVRIFPYNPRTVSTAFTRACLRLGIKDLRFHDLRHEGTSRLFEAGYQIPEVAIFTGHRDWGMLRRYTNLKARD